MFSVFRKALTPQKHHGFNNVEFHARDAVVHPAGRGVGLHRTYLGVGF